MQHSLLHLVLVFVCAFALSAQASTASAHTPRHNNPHAQSTSFLPGLTHRFQGSLHVAQAVRNFKQFSLQRAPTHQLREDLIKLDNTILKYTALNDPFMPSLAGPIIVIVLSVLTCAVGVGFLMAGALLAGFFNIINGIIIAGLIVLGVGVAGLAISIPWLIRQVRKRKKSKYYRKIMQLKQIKKAIILELRNRDASPRYGLQLPPVSSRGLVFAF